MKAKEYYCLAKRSLKEHKKSTASTVRGLAVGFIILIPIIVVLFGINVSINKQLNEVPYVLYMQTSMSDYRIDTDSFSNENGQSISGSENIDYFVNNTYIKNIITYETHTLLNGNGNTTLRVGDGEYNQALNSNSSFDDYYSVVDLDKSNSFFPQNLTTKYPGGIFKEGNNQGFTNDGKQQVVISENWLNLQGLQAEDVYLKTLTLAVNRDIYFSQEIKTNMSYYICYNFTIVGIIKSEISELYTFSDFSNRDSYMKSNLFFTSVNVYKDGVGVLKPHYTYNTDINSAQIIYDNLDEKDNLNKEYMMLGSNLGFFINRSYVNRTMFETMVYAESDSYLNLNKAIEGANSRINNIFGKECYSIRTSRTYSRFDEVFTEVNILTYLFSFVGIIIVLCAIINLFISIKHSVAQRKFYLTMMRAIGAQDNVIPKLYLTESAIIVSRANIFIATIGFAISAFLKIVIDYGLALKKIYYNLSIPWLIIFVCIFAVVISMYALSMLFAFICTYKLSKKPIVSILNKY